MTALQTDEYARMRQFMVPITVDQYHQMIRDGILEEGAPIELLDGFLVRKDRSAKGKDPMTVGHHHALTLGKLGRLVTRIEQIGGHLRIQQPITLPPDKEPEPDATIAIGGDDRRYLEHHPGPGEIFCVIEVADSSLHFDRTTKQRIYADNNLPQYLIINLADKAIEEYLEPKPGTGRYGVMNTFRVGQRLTLRVGSQSLDVAVADVLP